MNEFPEEGGTSEASHAIKLNDVRYMELNDKGHKIVLTDEAAERVATDLGLELDGRSLHIFLVGKGEKGEKGEETEKGDKEKKEAEQPTWGEPPPSMPNYA